MQVQLRAASPELTQRLTAWREQPEFQEYFRNCCVEEYVPLWAIEIWADDQCVGCIELLNMNPHAKTVEFSFLVEPKDRMEISNKAGDQLAALLFGAGFQKVTTRLLARREKLIQRLLNRGFVIEGLFKKSTVVNGELCDEVILSLFKE